MKILLIAGHGDGDCGALGCGYEEANLTREDSRTLKNTARQICRRGRFRHVKKYV